RHLLTVVSAGHPSPLLYRPGSAALTEVVPRDAAGVPLGIMEDMEFEGLQVTLQPGESLLLFSDGVLDPTNADNVPFGQKGTRAALEGASSASPRVLVERVFNAVQRHAAGRPPFDDITLVGIGRTA